MAKPVIIPFINPNEVEVLVVALPVTNGRAVRKGELIAALETTKASSELIAEQDGFIIGLRCQPGESLHAGEVLCYLADSADEQPPVEEKHQPAAAAGQPAGLPQGVRITRPALALAAQLGVELGRLPVGPLVTETVVRALAARPSNTLLESLVFGPDAILIYGGGGHGKTVIELVRAMGVYRVVGVVDDGLPPGSVVLGTPVLGGGSVLGDLYERGARLVVNAVGGIGNLESRLKVFDRLEKAGFHGPPVIHPRAFIEPSASLQDGVQVFALAYIGSDTHVGFGCIVNTGAILSHDCELGAYANISPGAILAGAVNVGERSLVGMGATVNLEVKIGRGARIGNGATVKTDVPDGAVVRAGTIWPPVT